MTIAITDLYRIEEHYKDRGTLEKAIGLDKMGSNASDIVNAIREVVPTQFVNDRQLDEKSWANIEAKLKACNKDALAGRVQSLSLPTIPNIFPKTLEDVKTFCEANESVIIKPITGSDSTGFREYHYRPLDAKSVLEEIELDLSFFKNQNGDRATRQAIIQKFYPLDGKDAYHYSFKGWVDTQGNFTLCHSYREEWAVDSAYDSARYEELTHQSISNALNLSATTYETDSKIDAEVTRQTTAFCKGYVDSCFMHGDAIINDGKAYLIDMSPVNNFATLVSFALEGKSRFLTFPIIMPEKGNRREQIALVSKHSGQYVMNERVNPDNKRFLYFLFTGASMKEIQTNRENYTKAIHAS